MQQAQDLFVEAFGGQRHGDFINIADVGRGDHARLRHIAEKRDFRFQVGAELAIAATNQNVGLDSDAQKLFYAVLRGLGLQLAGRGNEWHKSEVNEDYVFRAEFEAHLADCFQKRQRLDVANRAADFDDHYVGAVTAAGYFAESRFNFVGDMRNHLRGFPQIIAAALFGDNRFVDPAGSPIVVAR